MGLPVRLLFLTASARPAFFGCLSAGAGSPFAGHHYRAQTFRLLSNDLPFIFSFSAGAVSFSGCFGQTRLCSFSYKKAFLLALLGRAKFVERSSFSYDVDS